MEVDADDLSWSDHCGYNMVFSTTNMPSFCNEYSDSIVCFSALTTDIGDYTFTLTREQDGTTQTDTLTLSLGVDCTTKEWMPLTEGPQVFYTADETDTYYPDREMTDDTNGDSWTPHCG
jgi:hypothetical protein